MSGEIVLALALLPNPSLGPCPMDYLQNAMRQAQQHFGGELARTFGLCLQSPDRDSSAQLDVNVRLPSSRSAFCKLLADDVARGENEPTYIALSGDHSAVMIQFLNCMSEHNAGRELRHLEVLFIGQLDYAEKAREIVEGWGAVFTFESDARYNMLR